MSILEKLIPSLKEGHKEKIPAIVNSLIELLKKPPEMFISSNQIEQIDVQAFFSGKRKKEKKKKYL